MQQLLIVLRIALMVAFIAYFLRQVRKPTKYFGRIIVWLMNSSHSSLTDWGLSHFTIEKNFTVLDIGCGGGRTILKLSHLAPEGKVYGVDYSEGSVAASKLTNKRAVEEGRVEVLHGSVSKLPFSDKMFDAVTAVETHFYWPDLKNDMREVARVLKPGGVMMMLAETYRPSDKGSVAGPFMKLIKAVHLSAEEHRSLFADAGFTDIQVHLKSFPGWICVIGKKKTTAD